SRLCGGRDTEDSLRSVCFPLHASTPGPNHQGSPQVHTAPGPIKRLSSIPGITSKARLPVLSLIQATARHWQRIWIQTETPKRADARTGWASQGNGPSDLATSRAPYVDLRAGCLSRTLFFFFDEGPIGLHYLGRG
ncbi:hypothetical protein M9458_022594, partial [Cirrhinus mrigala]